MAERFFHISYGDEASFPIDEIWPDGDEPENPTVDDVIAQIKATSDRHTFDVDWGFYPNVEVDGKPVW